MHEFKQSIGVIEKNFMLESLWQGVDSMCMTSCDLIATVDRNVVIQSGVKKSGLEPCSSCMFLIT